MVVVMNHKFFAHEFSAAARIRQRALVMRGMAGVGGANRMRLDRFGGGHARTDHPRVLAAIAHTVRAGHAAGIPVEVCGEAAADPALVPTLIGLGVDELSAGAARVGELRAHIRTVSFDACRAGARAALNGAADGHPTARRRPAALQTLAARDAAPGRR